MPDLELKYSIEGEVQLARRLKNLSGRVKDFKPEFRKSTNFLKDFFGGQVFDTKGRAIGEPWKKRKVPRPWPLLQKSGRMRRGFKTRAKRLSGEVYNAVDYFKYHQSKAPRRRLPRRIMMKLTSQLNNKIVGFFHTGVYKRVQKSK
jgi:phage gpG-like protein